MADLDIPSLKVAELKFRISRFLQHLQVHELTNPFHRTELSKRDLSTKGLKAELAARLTEAVETQTDTTQDATPAPEQPPTDGDADVPTKAKEAIKEDEQVLQHGAVQEDESAKSNGAAPATDERSQAAPAEDVSQDSVPDSNGAPAAAKPAETLPKDKKELSPAAAESEAIVANQAASTEANDERESKRDEAVQDLGPQTAPPAEVNGEASAEADKTQTAPEESKNDDVDMGLSEVESQKDASGANPEAKPTPSEPSAQPNESEERKRKREEPAQESHGPSTTTPSEDTKTEPEPESKKRRTSASPAENAAKNPSDSQHQQPTDTSAPPPSECIFLNDLSRPFPDSELRERLEEFGGLGKTWIDKIKSHAYAQFESVGAAQRAKESINGTKWPHATSRVVTVTFLPIAAMEDLLKQEEQAAVLRKGRQDVDYSFEDGAWHFKLVPYGSTSRVAAAHPSQNVIRGLASAVPLLSRMSSSSVPLPGSAPPPPAHPRGLADRLADNSGRPPLRGPPGADSLRAPLRRADSGFDSRQNAADAYASRPRAPPQQLRPPPGGSITRTDPPIVFKPYKPL